MANADVEAPTVEQLINISGKSTTVRVKGINFQGITFANSDYNLVDVAGSHGRATVQTATAFIAFGDGNWHNSTYRIIDTLQAMIEVTSSESINFYSNVIMNSGCDGISMVNDVVNCKIIGNYFTNTASSALTIGHPQHVYIGDGGTHEKYAPGIEGVCKDITVNNNMFYDICTAPGFGGINAVCIFYGDTVQLTHNTLMKTATAAVALGWGWCNFNSSTTCRNNKLDNNRLIDTVNRTHDSGALYTLGQQPGTTVNENYVRGIPSQKDGPTYGLHIDEGSAYMEVNDNVLDIDPNVKYTINCEDYGQKHDLTILRTYATVNKMGKNPPNSKIDTPIVVSDNVWPLAQYNIVLKSGVQETYRSILPSNLFSVQDYVFPASCATKGGSSLNIRSSGNASNTVWFAPTGTTKFVEGSTMTRAEGTSTSIMTPDTAGTYKLFVVNSSGVKVGESAALLRVSGSASQIEAESYSSQSGVQTETCGEGGLDVCNIENGDYTVYNSFNLTGAPTTFQARVASATSGGTIEVREGSATGTLLGTCTVAGTGAWQTYTTASCTISGASGTHNLYLVYKGGSGYLFNLNWFKFTGSTPPALTGDLNGDSSVDSTDYALMKMYLLGSISDFPVENDLAAGDLNKDNVIDALDIAVFKKLLLGVN